MGECKCLLWDNAALAAVAFEHACIVELFEKLVVFVM